MYLSFLQGSLDFRLLLLNLLLDFLQLMNGFLAGSQLLCEVRDLLCMDENPSDHVEMDNIGVARWMPWSHLGGSYSPS